MLHMLRYFHYLKFLIYYRSSMSLLLIQSCSDNSRTFVVILFFWRFIISIILLNIILCLFIFFLVIFFVIFFLTYRSWNENVKLLFISLCIQIVKLLFISFCIQKLRKKIELNNYIQRKYQQKYKIYWQNIAINW